MDINTILNAALKGFEASQAENVTLRNQMEETNRELQTIKKELESIRKDYENAKKVLEDYEDREYEAEKS